MGEPVMCASVYRTFPHYVPNAFLAFPNLPNRRILANTIHGSQFSQLLINLCENTREYRRIFGIRLFSGILQELTYVGIRLYIKIKSGIFVHFWRCYIIHIQKKKTNLQISFPRLLCFCRQYMGSGTRNGTRVLRAKVISAATIR